MGVLAVDIVMVQLTLTEYVAIEFYHWILVLEFFFSIIKIKYLSANFKCDESPNESENEKQESRPRKRTKRPNNSQNYNNHNIGNNSPTLRCSRVKETKKVRAIVEISCLAHVTGSSSVSYVSLTCSAKCLLLYHQTCWKALLGMPAKKIVMFNGTARVYNTGQSVPIPRHSQTCATKCTFGDVGNLYECSLKILSYP